MINGTTFSISHLPNDIHQYSINTFYEIADDYKDRKIPCSANMFFDDVWVVSDCVIEVWTFDFASYKMPDGRSLADADLFPLRLFMKARTLRLFEIDSGKGQPYSVSSIHGMFSYARAILLPFLMRHGLLLSQRSSGKIDSLNRFTPSIYEELVAEIQSSPGKQLSKFNKLRAISHYISSDFSVPEKFRPPFCFPAKNLFRTDGNDLKGHDPIPDEDYFWIGRSSIEFVHHYAEDIVRLHDLAVAIWKTHPPEKIRAAYDSAISKGCERAVAFHNHVTPWRLKELAIRMQKTGAKIPKFTAEHERLWHVEQAYVGAKDSALSYESNLTTTFLYYLFQLLFGALCNLILIPTGMRNSELRQVDINNLSKFANTDGIFSYSNHIKKIKPSSTFYRENEIPIPVETWQALKLLARLSAPLRSDSTLICILPLNVKYSATCETDRYGTIMNASCSPVNAKGINNAIAVFSRFIRSYTIPTTHRFRKSIAEFMLCKTRKAPILICQLFGHRSITMTLKYLKRSSLIRREIKKYAVQRFRAAATIVAKAVSTNTAAGQMIERIAETINERETFRGLTQSEMMLAIEEWLLDKVKDQSLVLLHTPTNVCCRSTQARDKVPCLIPNDPIPAHPNPENCKGAKCSWALFTPEQHDELDHQLVFYKHLLKTLNPNDQKNQYILVNASEFIETYDPILDRIKRVAIADACDHPKRSCA